MRLFLFVVLLFAGRTDARATLENNAYKGVLVYIDPNVPENSKLLENLETSFKDASKILYSASK
jgi:hypothetical protein